MEHIKKINLGRYIFINFIFEFIECIVINNINGHGKLNIEKLLNKKSESGDNIYDDSEIELIDFVKLARKLQEQMQKDANS